jgi:hypothetical protein
MKGRYILIPFGVDLDKSADHLKEDIRPDIDDLLDPYGEYVRGRRGRAHVDHWVAEHPAHRARHEQRESPFLKEAS